MSNGWVNCRISDNEYVFPVKPSWLILRDQNNLSQWIVYWDGIRPWSNSTGTRVIAFYELTCPEIPDWAKL
jgi:hypothetical protein